MILSLLVIVGVLLGLHVPVFLFLWARLRRLLAFHQLVLGAALAACAQVVLTAYALSLLRMLIPWLWLALNAAAAGAWIALAWRRGLALRELRAALFERVALAKQLPRRPALMAVVVLSAIGVTFLVAKAWVYPVYDWDGANAHFAIARQMLQERGAPFQFASIPRITYATFVPHIFYAVVLSLPHGYEWVNGTNIYFLLLALLAQYGFVRRLGGQRSVALLVSPAVLFCPVLFQQATTGYVDLTSAAFVGAALPFLPTRRETALVQFTFASVALGLAVGSKESVLLLLPLLGLALLGWTWWAGARKGKAGLLVPVVVLLASVLLLGGYRYASSLRLYHNPIFPTDLRLPGVHLRGVGDTGTAAYGALYGHPVSDAYKWTSPSRQIWMSWREEDRYLRPSVYSSDNALGGLGPVWFVLFLPAIAVSLVFCRESAWLIPVAVFGIYLAVMPEARSLTRYVAFIFLLGPAAYALVESKLSPFGNTAWKTLLVAGVALAFFENIAFQQDADGRWLTALVSQHPSARFHEPSPAAQFLRDVPAAGQVVAAHVVNSLPLKSYFCWNQGGTDRVAWLADRTWLSRPIRRLPLSHITRQSLLAAYPDASRGQALQAVLRDEETAFAVVPPDVAREVATEPAYVLVIPSRPSADSLTIAPSPATVWTKVERVSAAHIGDQTHGNLM